VEFAGKASVQIVLSAINIVNGFMEGVVVWSTAECGWFPCERCADGQLFREVVA